MLRVIEPVEIAHGGVPVLAVLVDTEQPLLRLNAAWGESPMAERGLQRRLHGMTQRQVGNSDGSTLRFKRPSSAKNISFQP